MATQIITAVPDEITAAGTENTELILPAKYQAQTGLSLNLVAKLTITSGGPIRFALGVDASNSNFYVVDNINITLLGNENINFKANAQGDKFTIEI